MTSEDENVIAEVLSHYGMQAAGSRRAGHGLINATWIVTDRSGMNAVLQRLHPVIDSGANTRINTLATILASHGLCSPRVLATTSGELMVTHAEARWRLLTYIEGMTHDSLATPALAVEAGAMLGRFHAALAEADGLDDLPRSSIHELARHLDGLNRALAAHATHRAMSRVRPIAEQILEAATALPPVPPTADRIVHGDPKISNFLFSADGRAVALVDLDTVSRMPLAFELGDAFRSWCNPAGEDTIETSFSMQLFSAAIQGYARTTRGFIEDEEISGIVPAVATIYVELAARFCADALEESYFGWDPSRFASASEHNLVRAEGQLRAALALAARRDEASRLVAGALGADG